MHQCPVCPKSFPSPYKLQRHQVIHTGQKPFTCKICGNTFTQSSHLKTHLQKVHQSKLVKDCLQDGVTTNNQQPNCDKSAAGINTHDKSNCNRTPSAVFSPVASRWKEEIVTDKFVFPFSESGNPKDSSVTQNIIPDVTGPAPKEQADSANLDTSVSNDRDGYTCRVCLMSFSSSLQLWIHSPIHNKPKPSERGRVFHQTLSKKAHPRVDSGSQELISSKHKITLKHSCPKCLKTFCSPSKLQRHFLIHTGQKPYSCAVCLKAFRQKVHLKSHLSISKKCSFSAGTARKKQRLCNGNQTSDLPPRSSLQQRPIHCAPVNSSVELELQCKISVNALQDQRNNDIKSDAVVEPEKPLNSSICYTLNEQKQQYVTHKGSKPFQCGICSRLFLLKVNLLRHYKSHRNEKELGHPTAELNSNNVKISNSEATKHLPESSHADSSDLNITVKPETWGEICSDYNGPLPPDADLFTSAEQQKETCHATSKQQRINTSHQCHTCFKGFPSVSKLQRHIMTHTGQRPFGCEMCGKTFRQKTHLRVHCRTHMWSKYHKQRSLYINQLPSCVGLHTKVAADGPVQGKFVQKNDFQRFGDVVSVKHLDQTAPLISEKTKDNKQPENKRMLHTSNKNDVHTRKVAEATVTRTRTSRSVQNPGTVQHKCLQCLKYFPSASKLQRHELVHTGLKPFHCLVCGKAFRQAPHLKTHEITHCKRKASKPVIQQGNIRKLKVTNQQQLYTRITVHIPSQRTSVNTGAALSSFEAVSNEVNALLHTRHEMYNTEVNSLLKTSSISNGTCKKRRLHTCRICCKYFASPYKLSRHLVTHSGMRPYKCNLCCKSFTQKGHLKLHELRCRQGNRISDYIQSEMINTNHLQDKSIENLTDCTDVNVTETKEQHEKLHTSVGYFSFTDKDLAHCSEEIDTEWLAVPLVGMKEENNESEKKQGENCKEATDNYNLATDHYSYLFPSELAFEMSKLDQNQDMAAPLLSHQHDGNTHYVEIPCQPQGVATFSDNRLLSDEFGSPVIDDQMQPHNYWCEPLTVFECDKCAASFKSDNDLKQHICSESAQRNHCDICFKHFVSPSKLKRHYLIRTGHRPFSCDICGKRFTQAAHVRTHQLTH